MSISEKHIDPSVEDQPGSPEIGSGCREVPAIKKGLSSRHVQFIAIGGTIGTGLFVSSGRTLALGGPAFLVGSYVLMSALVYLILSGVTEISAYITLPGATMNYYGSRYVSPSLGFMMGWLYFYSFAITVPFELTSAALVIDYWGSSVNNAVWITILLVLVVALNFLPVKYYGESEFWFASLKVILVLGLLILSFILFWGGGPSHQRLGFWYWQNPGAANTYIVNGDAGRFVAGLATLISTGIAFAFTPETIVVTSGEMKAPRKNLPRASRTFFWRLLVLYIGSALAISVICPSNAKALISGQHGAAASPWVVGIRNAGIPVLDSIINAVIITAAWSAGNSILYLASRALYSLALQGHAPSIFGKCSQRGVPYYAVGASSLFCLLAYLNINSSASTVFGWLLNLVNSAGFISWICCSITIIRFRKACDHQNIEKSHLVARSKLHPIGAYITLVVFTLLCLLNGFTVFFPSQWSAANFLSAYIGIPLFVLIYFGHRFYRRHDPWAIPLDLVDLHSGLEEMETEGDSEPTGEGKFSCFCC
ncbi:proline permease PrnB [Xylariaceae sp. FL0255]|nr:proline permease PrnB [Xylariaceae sp. FL0255]